MFRKRTKGLVDQNRPHDPCVAHDLNHNPTFSKSCFMSNCHILPTHCNVITSVFDLVLINSPSMIEWTYASPTSSHVLLR